MVTGGGYKRRGWESSLLTENYLPFDTVMIAHTGLHTLSNNRILMSDMYMDIFLVVALLN